jgi:hypothetical protein
VGARDLFPGDLNMHADLGTAEVMMVVDRVAVVDAGVFTLG